MARTEQNRYTIYILCLRLIEVDIHILRDMLREPLNFNKHDKE